MHICRGKSENVDQPTLARQFQSLETSGGISADTQSFGYLPQFDLVAKVSASNNSK